MRAAELDLERPLYYALRHAVRLLNTPVPADVLREAEIGRPPIALRCLMDAILLRALQPDRANMTDGLASLARGSLYVRAHWLRIPPLLLAQHLMVKAFQQDNEIAT
jgi:hypothetical protein